MRGRLSDRGTRGRSTGTGVGFESVAQYSASTEDEDYGNRYLSNGRDGVREQHGTPLPLGILHSNFTSPSMGSGMLTSTLLQPFLDSILLAVVLLGLRWYFFRHVQDGHDPSQGEGIWATMTRWLWIAWLTHAAGVMDEMFRVFLGIQLTRGLGTPTSVGKVYSKMSRRAEVVAEDIAVDDFPALATLYAGALSARGAQRASSGEVGEDSSTPDARVDKSLVMKVDHMAVTAQLWSLTPWSRVRRYDKVHVKGITLRLRQVNGILNFSFLALRKSPGYDSGRSANASSDSSRVVLNRADSASGDGTTSNSAMRSGGMEELDGIEVAGAAALTDNEEDASTLSSEEEFAAPGQQVAVHQHGNSREHDSLADETADAPNSPRDSITTTNTWGGASAGSTASNGRLAGILARKNRRIFAPRTSSLKGSHVTTRANGRIGDVHPAHRKSSSARDAEGGMSPPPGALSAARNRRIKRPAFVPFSGRNHLGAEGSANGSRAATPAAVGTSSGSSETPAENRGNMGVVKVLGEAFMRRFNAYAEQVSAAFNRVGEIKLVPNVRGAIFGAAATGRRRKRAKQFEVGEILLEDVCICVDSCVWNDLLGDHVGAAFSPEFRLDVKVGPHELLTENGEGRLAKDIGMKVNDKLIRLLTRLVMRETLKTSTLASMVITSLALDTDARVRQQTKNKSLSPPPLEGEDTRSDSRALGRAFPSSSAAAEGVFTAESKIVDGHRRGARLWRGSSRIGLSAATTASDLPPTSSGRRQRVISPRPSTLLINSTATSSGRASGGHRSNADIRASATSGTMNHSRWRRPGLPKFAGSGPVDDAAGGGGAPTPGALSHHDAHLASEARGVLNARKTFQSRAGKSKRGWRRASEPTMRLSSSPGQLRLSNDNQDCDREIPQGLQSRGGVSVANELDQKRRCRSAFTRAVAGNGHVLRQSDDTGGAEEKEWEAVAKPPPWLEGVAASAEYEEMKPALDVIKRTVLLALFQQSNQTFSTDGRYGGSSSSSNGGSSRMEERREMDKLLEQRMQEERREMVKVLERKMQEELSDFKRQGKDVDRLVMKELMSKVRDSGPQNAFQALASIEISSLIESLAAETHFASYFENVGVDIGHVARSISGRTAGELVEGVKMTADKVGAQAQRLRTEALRWRKELLDDNGILPLLSDASGGNASLASLVETLSDTILPVNMISAGHGGGPGSEDPRSHSGQKNSWERGVAISTNPAEKRHRLNTGIGAGAFGDLEEVDEVDVIMQVLDLLEAVEGLKEGIWKGDSRTLGKVEQAVGKVAERIDVYLILAAGESMLGFLLERLHMLPVGHAKFSARGVESRVSNLNLEGVRVAREKVDLVMGGFRLPKRGSPVMTPMGRGTVKRYKKRSRCFVINLDWKMSNGKPVKAYLQPNYITVLEGHDGALSEEEDETEDAHHGTGKIKTDRRDIQPVTASADIRTRANDGAISVGKDVNRHGEPNSIQLPQSQEVSDTVPSETCRSSEKSKGSVRNYSLSKMWNRRKSTDTITDGGSGSECRARVSDGETVGGKGGEGVRGIGRRRASAPVMATPPPPAVKIWRRRGRSNPDLPPGATASAMTREGTPPELLKDDDVDGDERSGTDVETTRRSPGLQQSLPKIRTEAVEEMLGAAHVRGPYSGGGGGGGGDHGVGQSDGSPAEVRVDGNSLAGPSGVDIMAAPFLVARISGVGAELKDVKWSVRQTHFPHLKTAGSLEAKVSGLTIELELNTQDLAVSTPWNLRVRAGRNRCVNSDAGSVGQNGAHEQNGRGAGYDGTERLRCGNRGAFPAQSVRSTLGDTPKGLRLSRLRVSVRTVKVHVSNSSLSGVYNLVAVAFEATLKRHVVESVEAAVRKSMNALLAMINHQVSEKWDLLRSVGGGAGGSTAQQAVGGDRGSSPPQRVSGNAVDKVLAASLSHPVVWAPPSSLTQPQHAQQKQRIRLGSPAVSDCKAFVGDGDCDSSAGVDKRSNDKNRGAAALSSQREGISPPSAQSADDSQSSHSRGDVVESGSTGRLSRASTDSSAPDMCKRGGSTAYTAEVVCAVVNCSITTATAKEKFTRPSFRKRVMGVVSRPLGENDMPILAPPSATSGELLTKTLSLKRTGPGNCNDQPRPSHRIAREDRDEMMASRMGMKRQEKIPGEKAHTPPPATRPAGLGSEGWEMQTVFGGGKAAIPSPANGAAFGVRQSANGKV